MYKCDMHVNMYSYGGRANDACERASVCVCVCVSRERERNWLKPGDKSDGWTGVCIHNVYMYVFRSYSCNKYCNLVDQEEVSISHRHL